jgi:hypothetical protein
MAHTKAVNRRPRARREDDANAFFPDPNGGPAVAPEPLAEALGEEFIGSATSGQDKRDEEHEEFVSEEVGGPFVETRAKEEFADGVDGSNPIDAEPAPLPTATPLPPEVIRPDEES